MPGMIGIQLGTAAAHGIVPTPPEFSWVGPILPNLAVAPGPLAPAWAVVPLAILAVLILAAHLWTIARVPSAASTIRIRTVNAALMLLATPVLAYALSIADPRSPRTFAIAWTLAAGLITLVLLVAFLDMLNTLRLGRLQRRSLRQQAALELAQLRARPPHPDAPSSPPPSPTSDA